MKTSSWFEAKPKFSTPPTLMRAGALTYSRLRNLGFTAEFLALKTLSDLARLSSGEKKVTFSPDFIRLVQEDLDRLLKDDSDRIANHFYPIQVLTPESPLRHWSRIPKIIMDGVRSEFRRKKGSTTAFSDEARERLDDLPRYYRRNFHFQTDGYLSETSAELYEHQVEILFRGAADAMRRLLIQPLKEKFGTTDGKGLKFLEVACGTGSTTRFMHQAFPKAKIIATDLSDPYLMAARKRGQKMEGVHYLQAAGEALPFRDGEFDASYSVFLFHELPFESRQDVINEQMRVTRSGGFVGAIDSVQAHDTPQYLEALERFPADYHEPFYRNYLKNPLEDQFSSASKSPAEVGRGFFSKWVLTQKA